MNASIIISVIVIYFLVLIIIAKQTAGKGENAAFFLGNRKSPWYVVAFGMIGASLSGITFISIPGWVGNEVNQFSYMQAVLGYMFGYAIIAYVLLPIYYRLNLVSIYTYLDKRFGFWSYKTGAAFFFLSRVIGASVRLLLVSKVLQLILFDEWGVPFEFTVLISVLLIWIYTNKGGIKTIIWTDTLQTAFMLLSVIFTVYLVSDALNLEQKGGLVSAISNSGYSKIFFFTDINGGNHFLKHFFGGIFICIGMTGLDQDMMQKNLSCKNIKDAQKNMLSLGGILVLVNLMFLSLGALLYMYAQKTGVGLGVKSDLLFAEIAMSDKTGNLIGILFLLGLIAAAYSSADSALTSLTTSFSMDFLNISEKPVKSQERIRKYVHVGMSLLIISVVIALNYCTTDTAIDLVMKFAGFTYGPLIGLFFFGILTKRKLIDKLVLPISLAVPLLVGLFWWYSFGGPGIEENEPGVFGFYKFGYELIIYNSIVSFLFLWMISKKEESIG